jgi:hypothetical protein
MAANVRFKKELLDELLAGHAAKAQFAIQFEDRFVMTRG